MKNKYLSIFLSFFWNLFIYYFKLAYVFPSLLFFSHLKLVLNCSLFFFCDCFRISYRWCYTNGFHCYILLILLYSIRIYSSSIISLISPIWIFVYFYLCFSVQKKHVDDSNFGMSQREGEKVILNFIFNTFSSC